MKTNTLPRFFALSFLPILLLPSCKNLQPILLEGANQLAQAQLAPSKQETGSAIKSALKTGVKEAVNLMGRENAFYRSSAKILLPKELRKAGDKARQIGLVKYVDDFELSMNRAAEKAVPQALSILADSLSRMTLRDAIGIMRGPQDAATQYFKRSTSQQIRQKFLPIVRNTTQSTGVTRNYKKLASKVNALGRLAGISMPAQSDLDNYITQQAIDALFIKIGEKEQAIRENPLQASSALVRRVFSYYQ